MNVVGLHCIEIRVNRIGEFTASAQIEPNSRARRHSRDIHRGCPSTACCFHRSTPKCRGHSPPPMRAADVEEGQPSIWTFECGIHDREAEELGAVECTEQRCATSHKWLAEGDLGCDAVWPSTEWIPRRDFGHRHRTLSELAVANRVLDIYMLGSIDPLHQVDIVDVEVPNLWWICHTGWLPGSVSRAARRFETSGDR